MKTLIIYHSKTGMTKRYAEWIQAELNCKMIPWKEARKTDLSGYERIIFGSSFHAGMILALKPFLQKVDSGAQQVMVFATGASPASSPEIAKALEQNITDDRIRTFYFQSGLCYEKMGLLDRLMMTGFRSMVKKQEGEASQTYQMISHSYDLCDQAAIAPLVEACQT